MSIMFVTPATHKTISSEIMKKRFPAFVRRERVSASFMLAAILISILF